MRAFSPARTKLKLAWALVRSSKLAHDAGKLLALQFAGRIVAFFAAAVAMRSLGPEQLGVGSFVLSIVAIGSLFGDLGLSISGVRSLSNDPQERDHIVSAGCALRLWAGVFLAVVMLAGVWAFHPIGSQVAWLLAAPLLALSVLNPQWIFQGLERVPAFNVVQLAQTLAMAVLYFGLFRPGARAELYVAVALGAQVGATAWAFGTLRRYVKVNWLYFDAQAVWAMIRSSGYAYAIVLAIFVYAGLEIPLITLLLSSQEAGIYRAAQGIVSAVFPLISILPLLVYPRLIVWKNRSDREFKRNAGTAMLLLAGLALTLNVGALVFVPPAFHLLLGPGFEAGTWPCILLFVAKGFELMGAIPSWGLLAYGLDRRQFIVAATTAGLSLVLNVLLIPRFGIMAAATVGIIREAAIFVLSALVLFSFLRTGPARLSPATKAAGSE